MDQIKAMGAGARAAFLAGGAVLAGAVGYSIWSVNQPAAPSDAVQESPASPAIPANVATSTKPEALPQTEATDPAASEPANAADPVIVEPEPQTLVPTFDLVRVEPDGQAVVAGKAAPGARVLLRLDGAEISATTANAQGDFVVLFVLDPSAAPRMLTMSSILPDQAEIAASGAVALAPTTAPISVAQAIPDPEPDPPAAEPAPADAVADAVPTQDAPAALLITKDGASVLQSPDQPFAADAPVTLSLDAISYTPSGEVQLAGRAAAGAVVRVYLDNAPLIDVAVGEDGRWASTMPPITPGIYTLRVDALAADGTVTSRFETPFKRETQQALAAVVQSDVADVAPAPVAPAADPAAAVDPEATATADASATAESAVPSASAALIAPDSTSAATTTAADATVPAPIPVSITVQPGFTLWGIASEQFGDGVLYVQVFEANKDKIRDPDLIYPGQVFVIPAGSN